MFYIRDVQVSDLTRVHEFTLSLLQHHIGQGTTSHLDSHGLEILFNEGYLMGLLLVRSTNELSAVHPTTTDVKDEPVGCMLYHLDVSSFNGGCGVSLDQFYIEPSFRRMGLGRQMMTVLCKKVLNFNGTYIKLVYQDGLGLETVYGNLGFVNHTRHMTGLHIFEIYGKSGLNAFLEQKTKSIDVTAMSDSYQISKSIDEEKSTRILVIPLSPNYSCLSFSEFGFPEKKAVPSKEVAPLPTQLIVVIKEDEISSIEVPHNIQRGTRMCLFIEQCAVCSWVGPLVNFSDFTGDISILEPKLFVERVRAWTERFASICGAIWEVPCGMECVRPESYFGQVVDRPDMSKLMHNPLVSCLTSLGVPDDTMREGWNIVCLNKEGMLKLTACLTENITIV